MYFLVQFSSHFANKFSLKEALNPNFLILTINRENFSLYQRFGPISYFAYFAFVKKL